MPTLPEGPPSVTVEKARALLVLADPRSTATTSQLHHLLVQVLPDTDTDNAMKALAGIRGHLAQAEVYRAADASYVHEMFGATGAEAEGFVKELHIRADVWHSEAVTLATTVALRDTGMGFS